MCWLPALDSGGLDDLHYNIYLFNTELDDPEFNKVNTEPVVQENGQNNICYELEGTDTSESYGIIVVSANGATGDPPTLMNLDEVQGHSITFFLSRGQAACNGKDLYTNNTLVCGIDFQLSESPVSIQCMLSPSPL